MLFFALFNILMKKREKVDSKISFAGFVSICGGAESGCLRNSMFCFAA